MPVAQVPAILHHAVCPEELFSDDYDKFIRTRADMLARAGRELCAAA
jgi:hypothetical protein